MVVSASAIFHIAGLAAAATLGGAGFAQDAVAVESSKAQLSAAKGDLYFMIGYVVVFGAKFNAHRGHCR